MSFFNSLQQYVTSGVAGLGLSPRRFSMTRPESEAPSAPQSERRESGNAQHHGKYWFCETCNTNEFIYLFVFRYREVASLNVSVDSTII